MTPDPDLWQDVQFGGARADEFRDFVVTEHGLFIGGYRDGVVGVDRFDPSGNAVGFVQVRSLDGRLQTEHVFDTAGADVVEAMVRSGDDLYIAGRTSGAFAGFSNAGQLDLFVSRLPVKGAQGEPLPLLQVGDERPQQPRRIAVDASGNLLVAGFDDVYVPTNYVESWEDPLTARITVGQGAQPFALDWMRRGGTAESDVLLGMAPIETDGELIVSGQSQGGPAVGAFVERLRPDGTIAWRTRFNRLGFDTVAAVTWGPDGQLYVAGSSFMQLGDIAYGQQDVFVVVLDPTDGHIVRSMQAGSEESEWVRDLKVDSTGAVWVAGGTLGAFPGFTYQGEQDAFVARFAPDGSWTAWQHGTPGWDEVNALAIDDKGNAYLAGQAGGVFVSGEVFGGERDAFLVRITPNLLKPAR